MEPNVMVYILVAAMAASGGVLGAFWVRALTIMRRRMVDSGEELARLNEAVARQHQQLTDVLQRLERAERALTEGPHRPSGQGDTPSN